MLFWPIVLVAGGLVLLLFSGDLLVRGAVALARRFSIPPLVIGLTIVAFGTSAPELFIGIDAALIGSDEALGIALGNVVGSNIANILLVLGLPALLYPIACRQRTVKRNTAIMGAATLVFIALCYDARLTGGEGVLLFGLIVIYLLYSALRTAHSRRRRDDVGEMAELEELTSLPRSLPLIVAFMAIALIGLPAGAHLIITGAADLARAAGVSPSVIGLSLVAVGTSLPELATTLVAALRRQSAVALGNVIGSNIFNLLAIMGVTAMVAGRPILVESRFLHADLWIMLGASALVVPYVLLRAPMDRFSGVLFLAAYAAYVVFLFANGGH
jgi:cation:H+ antiporter